MLIARMDFMALKEIKSKPLVENNDWIVSIYGISKRWLFAGLTSLLVE